MLASRPNLRKLLATTSVVGAAALALWALVTAKPDGAHLRFPIPPAAAPAAVQGGRTIFQNVQLLQAETTVWDRLRGRACRPVDARATRRCPPLGGSRGQGKDRLGSRSRRAAAMSKSNGAPAGCTTLDEARRGGTGAGCRDPTDTAKGGPPNTPPGTRQQPETQELPGSGQGKSQQPGQGQEEGQSQGDQGQGQGPDVQSDCSAKNGPCQQAPASPAKPTDPATGTPGGSGHRPPDPCEGTTGGMAPPYSTC